MLGSACWHSQLKTSILRRAAETMGSSAGFSDRPTQRTTLLSRIRLAARNFAFVPALVCGTLFLALYLSLEQQRQVLAEERRKLAEVLLAQYVDTARVFMLNDDLLGLDLLLAEPSHMDGLRYVAVVDTRGIITAYSDRTKVGSRFETAGKRANEPGAGRLSVDRSSLTDGTGLVDLTTPIVFGARDLGSFHVGMSLKELRSRVNVDVVPLLYPLILFAALIALTVTAVSMFLRMRCERSVRMPIAAAEHATRVNHEVPIPTIPTNKLGDPAKAFRETVAPSGGGLFHVKEGNDHRAAGISVASKSTAPVATEERSHEVSLRFSARAFVAFGNPQKHGSRKRS
jgi:hypothetical protein